VVDLDTRLLRAFVAVAEELNFTRAAERLHLAQQALSSQIRQLETRLGVTLFERTTRKVEPTPAADALLPHARAALQAIEDGAAAARAQRGDAQLVVALFPLASTELTGTILKAHAAAHPDTALEVRPFSVGDAIAALKQGRAQVAFVRPPLSVDGLSMVTISSEPRVAVLPADHALARHDEVDPADLAREPQVFVEGADPAQAAFWTLAAHRGDAEIRIGAHINSFDEFFGVVSAGLAVGACPAGAAEHLAAAYPGVAFRPIRGVEPSTVAVAWPTARETAATRAFVRTALEHAHAPPA
jgi:DNA-binding transcriptional LysR family regulator